MKHDVIYRRDPDGTPVVGVKLTNRPARAWVNRADFEAVVGAIGLAPWFSHATGKGREYVRVSPAPKCGPVSVSRLIAAAQSGSSVHLRDRDHLNLRARNLFVRSESSPSSDAHG